MTTENQDDQKPDDINDIDTPVDEKLLSGEGDEVEPDDKPDDADALKAEDDTPPAGDDEVKPDDGKPSAVPQARFNQVYAENKALKERLAELEAKTQPTEPTPDAAAPVDLKALRRQATNILVEAMLLGDDPDSEEKYATHDELQEQIYKEVQRRAEAQVETRLTQRSDAAAFKAKVTELTDAYPVLNPETGDPEAIELVVELRDSYITKGMSMADALEKAVLKIAPKFSEPAKDPVDKAADEVADARKAAAIKRGVQANNAIPPQGGGVGNRAMPPSKSGDIPQAEWDVLTPAARQKHLEAAG